ncbi:MAG: hypothetical protein J6X60_09165, partial [Ruminiclostridium sp.]|nr:hypothetical protein [Ruminiclostridium sp.]
MLSRRQKKALYGFTAALTCTVFLSAFLIFFNISGSVTEEPVVFSDILEGASEINDDSDVPALTMASDVLMETMYSEKYATFTLPDDPYLPASYEQTEPFLFSSYEDIGSDTLSAVSYETASYPDDTAGIPLNPNEITLLSDELEQFRTSGGTGNEVSLLQNETLHRDTGTPDITVSSVSQSNRTTTEITAPTSSYSSKVTSGTPTTVASHTDITTNNTTVPTTKGTVTAPSTVSSTSRKTTASVAS